MKNILSIFVSIFIGSVFSSTKTPDLIIEELQKGIYLHKSFHHTESFGLVSSNGLVVVEIRVNRNGDVIKATPGKQGTKGGICLFEAARKTAMSFKFTPNESAPNPQIGFVTVNFKLGQ